MPADIQLSIFRPDILCLVFAATESIVDLTGSGASLSPRSTRRLGRLNGMMPRICSYDGSVENPLAASLLADEIVLRPGFSEKEIDKFGALLLAGIELLGQEFPGALAQCLAIESDVFLVRIAGSEAGSNANSIGTMWLSPESGWTKIEFADRFLHESVHSLIFALHMALRIFKPTLTDLQISGITATSAIRQVPRRYDLAFHSAFVAYCLARFHERVEGAAKARDFIGPLLTCLEGLHANAHVLTSFGLELLSELTSASTMLASAHCR